MSELLSTFLEYMILVCWSLPRSVLFCIKDKDKAKDKDKDNDQYIDKDMRVQEPGVVPCQGQVCFAPAKSPGRSWWGPNGRPQARPSPMGGTACRQEARVFGVGEASTARALLYKGSQEASALNIKQLEVGNMAPRNAGRNFFFRPSLMIFAVTADKIKTITQARRQTNHL